MRLASLLAYSSMAQVSISTTDLRDRHFRVLVHPSSSLQRVAPSLQIQKQYNVSLNVDGSVTGNGHPLPGWWTIRRHPYELLERIPDDIFVESQYLGLRVDCICKYWDRHLPRCIPRRLTHGVITAKSPGNSPRLVIATFNAREIPAPKRPCAGRKCPPERKQPTHRGVR